MSRASASVRRVARALEQRLLTLVAALTAVVLLVLFYYPVATVFADAVLADGRLTVEPIAAVLTSEFYLVDIIWFTAKQAFYSTLASLALGLPAAWLFARFEFRGRETLRSLTILPFVMPSIMVAIGFVATFGRNGTLNRALSLVGLPPVELLFTLEAIVVAHAFYNAPLVARVVTAAWESVDARTVEVVPRYLGKCGKFGASGTDLNSNLRNVDTNDGKLARWGYGNYYHFGDLSSAAFRDDGPGKYDRWVAALFASTDPPRLREPVYFWVEPWAVGTEGPYPDTRPYLEELEYQLIGIAFELYPERLLNTEGVPTNPEAYAKMRGWTDREDTRLSDF